MIIYIKLMLIVSKYRKCFYSMIFLNILLRKWTRDNISKFFIKII